jgi:pimeloyl-ACP methyl ester carboxylesterase
MTDMSFPPAMEGMPGVGTVGLAATREEAIAIAERQFNTDSSSGKSTTVGAAAAFGNMPEADVAVIRAGIADPAAAAAGDALKFANGMQGYVDDRRADAPGWFSFDVGKVTCPVVICHGESDTVVPVLAAHHTKSLVPHAELRLYQPLGHMSIGGETLKAAGELGQAVQ